MSGFSPSKSTSRCASLPSMHRNYLIAVEQHMPVDRGSRKTTRDQPPFRRPLPITALMLSFTLLAASTVHLAFRAKSLGEIREWMYGTHYKYKSGIFRPVTGNSQYYGGGQTMRYDPRKMLPLYYELHLANAVIGLFTSIIVSFITVRAFSRGPVQMVPWARFSLFLMLIISAILALMSMAFTLAGLAQSSHFDLDYANSLPFPDGILYDKGSFAAQTWACGVMDIPKFDEEGWLHSVCRLSQGSTALGCIMFGLLVSFSVVIWLDWREHHLAIVAFNMPYVRVSLAKLSEVLRCLAEGVSSPEELNGV